MMSRRRSPLPATRNAQPRRNRNVPQKESEKVVPLRREIPPFEFGQVAEDDVTPSAVVRPVAQAEATVVQGVDLSGVPKIVMLAGRGRTGKTLNARWMCDRALSADRPVLMGDLDPTNASFSSYFSGVHRPRDTDDPSTSLKWLERFIGHAMQHRATAVIDLGGGDTTLRRLASELPDLPAMVEGQGAAIALLYHVGSLVDDLAPLAAMEERGFQPKATAVLMNEAAMEPGYTRDDGFARVQRQPVFKAAIARGVVPAWMPRLHASEPVEAKRLHFSEAAGHAVGPDGAARIGLIDAARVRLWLAAMERQLAGIWSWLP